MSAPGRSQALIPEPLKGEGTPVSAPGRPPSAHPGALQGRRYPSEPAGSAEGSSPIGGAGRRPSGAPVNPRRRELLAALAATAALWPARDGAASPSPDALPAEVAAELPAARLQGSGRLRAFGLHVYDARLWRAERRVGADDWDRTPLALEIVYARRLRGERIAERSLAEMLRQGAIAEADGQRWLDEMKRLFPDVAAGDRITGVQLPGQSVRFFVNGRLVGEVRDAGFVRRFFGIWLAGETSEPALRAALLGAGSPSSP
jgi:hypothetical protein